MWQHGMSGFTAGLFTQFVPPPKNEERSSAMRYFPPLKRAFRSQYINPTADMDSMNEYREADAGASLQRRRIVDKFWSETHDLPPRERARAALDMLNMMPKTYDTALVRKALSKKFSELNLSRDERRLRTMTASARAKWLIDKMMAMEESERLTYWNNLRGKGVVSPAVTQVMVEELNKMGGVEVLFPRRGTGIR